MRGADADLVTSPTQAKGPPIDYTWLVMDFSSFVFVPHITCTSGEGNALDCVAVSDFYISYVLKRSVY